MSQPMMLSTYDGAPIAPVRIADSFVKRFRGLMGAREIDFVMLLPHTRSVHTAFMRMPIDVAFVDHREDDTMVIKMVKTNVAPWRGLKASRPSNAVIEAQSGAFAQWGIEPGLVLRLRPDRVINDD